MRMVVYSEVIIRQMMNVTETEQRFLCYERCTDLRYRPIALRYWTIARLRHRRPIAQKLTDDIHRQLIQHSCAIDRFVHSAWLLPIYSAAQKTVCAALSIDSAVLSVVSANPFSLLSIDDGANERSSNSEARLKAATH